MNGSLTINLTAEQVAKILSVLVNTTSPGADSISQIQFLMEQDTKEKTDLPSPAARELGFLLSGRAEQLVRYVTANRGEVNNNDLAHELGFENPAFTSSLLGKITLKLRRVGIQAEGRNGLNWYSKRRVKGQTLLRVRPDVLKVLERAVAAIPR
ncbi:MAG: hypothetical protein WCC22_14210 [Terriglobales bacterium]